MTENPVEIFRRQRETILHAIVQLQALRNNYREARKVTGEGREKMYAYLRRQDEHFYQKLRNFYGENRPAIKIIEFLIQDMKELKIKTFGFFEKYGVDNPHEQGRNFIRDLREYNDLIRDRFRVEEDYLVPLLKRMSEESGLGLLSK